MEEQKEFRACIRESVSATWKSKKNSERVSERASQIHGRAKRVPSVYQRERLSYTEEGKEFRACIRESVSATRKSKKSSERVSERASQLHGRGKRVPSVYQRERLRYTEEQKEFRACTRESVSATWKSKKNSERVSERASQLHGRAKRVPSVYQRERLSYMEEQKEFRACIRENASATWKSKKNSERVSERASLNQI
ncbi:hypothetical protein ACDX78_21645 [Virgibacillus oceani]